MNEIEILISVLLRRIDNHCKSQQLCENAVPEYLFDEYNRCSAAGNLIQLGAHPMMNVYHIVPRNMWKHSVIKVIIAASVRGEFNINGVANGLAVPHPHTAGVFDHPRYSAAVVKMIRSLPDGLRDAQYVEQLAHRP
jgi:hypothetical protein